MPRQVANVRSDTRAVLGVVGEGYEPLPEPAGVRLLRRDHRLRAGALDRRRRDARRRSCARADAARPRDPDRGAEEEVLPLLCFRNGHDGGLAVTVSVAPFRLACLNGMLFRSKARSARGRRGTRRTWRRSSPMPAARSALPGPTTTSWRDRRKADRERMGGSEFGRFLARSSHTPGATGGSQRRRARRPQRRAGARGDPHRLPDSLRPRRHPRHPLGRAPGRRPTSTTSSRPGRRPDGRTRGPLRARDGATAAQGPGSNC